MSKRTHDFGFNDLEGLIERVTIIIIKMGSAVSLILMLIKFLEDQISSW
jgi:hypothetical protein